MSTQSQVSSPPVYPFPQTSGAAGPLASPIPEPEFASPRFKADPFPYYARLRAEAPVFPFTVFGKERGWLVTRYDDVATVLKHPDLYKDRFSNLTDEQRARLPWFLGLFKPLMNNMLSRDPPDHTRLRGLVHQAFTPHLVERLRARAQAITDRLLDAALQKRTADLVADLALPLPVTIIAELLGIPKEDHGKFHCWSNRLVSNTTSLETIMAIPAVLRFQRYIHRQIEERRAAPGDDLLSALVHAEEAGDRLSQDELVSMVFLLLLAGHETTVNLISGGILALLQHPDQLERLRREPQLIGTAVEELARYVSPVELATIRLAREGFTVAGTKIPRGEFVMAVLASANRDERHFPNADRLDLGREPNKHVAFGMGIHYCLGAPLARLEGAIAIQSVLRRMPHLQLARPAESLRWRSGLLMRGVRSLPVTV